MTQQFYNLILELPDECPPGAEPEGHDGECEAWLNSLNGVRQQLRATASVMECLQAIGTHDGYLAPVQQIAVLGLGNFNVDDAAAYPWLQLGFAIEMMLAIAEANGWNLPALVFRDPAFYDVEIGFLNSLPNCSVEGVLITEDGTTLYPSYSDDILIFAPRLGYQPLVQYLAARPAQGPCIIYTLQNWADTGVAGDGVSRDTITAQESNALDTLVNADLFEVTTLEDGTCLETNQMFLPLSQAEDD